jgi:hypothetical protein
LLLKNLLNIIFIYLNLFFCFYLSKILKLKIVLAYYFTYGSIKSIFFSSGFFYGRGAADLTAYALGF